MLSSYAILRAVVSLVDIYSTIIVVYCLMSWIPRSSGGIVEDIEYGAGVTPVC